ncbi:CrcB family protein [Halomonas sp. Bachu 37]|uniref:fluoride efflux transporter FluC n=1 Tax=Halomonas kashgarensis TaxID=3084920 RepID=UPI003217BDBC
MIVASGLGWVMLGGALGGVARVAVSNTLARWIGTAFPWGTLVVNLSAAFLIGLAAGILLSPDLSTTPQAWTLLAAGLLGGYSTVSSLSLQTLSLWQEGRLLAAISNMTISCLGGIALAAAGWWLGGRLG